MTVDALRLADIRDLARKAVRECRATKRNAKVKVEVQTDTGRMWFVAEPSGYNGRVHLSLFRDLDAYSPSPVGAAILEGAEEALAVDIWQVRSERAGPSLEQLRAVFP